MSQYSNGKDSALVKLGLAHEFAPGIPASREIKPLPEIAKPETWQLAIQKHLAEKAGPHFDLRLIPPGSQDAHSWALPAAKLPEPGKSVLAIPQPTHTSGYALTFGKKKPEVIGEGYGKGTVSMHLLSDVDVFHSKAEEAGTRVRFNLYKSTGPEEYAIVRTQGENDILVNKTITQDRAPYLEIGHKPKSKDVDIDKIDVEDNSLAMMPKYDGAHTLLDLREAGKIPRLFSYRKPVRHTAGLIEHTHKVPELLTQKIPAGLGGTTLRVETVGVDKSGKAVPAKDIAGMLNAHVTNSRAKQEETGVTLRPILFDITRYRGRDVSDKPFSERKKLVDAIGERMGLPVAEVATTPEDKRKLLQKIRSGKHKLTGEGVMLRPLEGPGPLLKAKIRPDHDVYVREIFEAQDPAGAGKGRAGGFRYSWSPKGEIAGRVGTGFSHAEARDMLRDPDKYIGRVAKVEAETKYISGALGKPAFKEWHLEKGDVEKLGELTTPLQPHQQRVVDRIKNQPGLVVAHGLGSGKTLSSIAAAEQFGGPTDVVVPASLRTNYQKEIDKHISGTPAADYNIQSLQGLARSKTSPQNPFLIVDESHRLRNPGTAGYQAIANSPAEHRLLLTGSPLYNRPHDLAVLVNLAAGQNVLPNSEAAFKAKYQGEKTIHPSWWAEHMEGIKPGSVPVITNKRELAPILNKWVDYHENAREGFPTREDAEYRVPMDPSQQATYEGIMESAPGWISHKIKHNLPPAKSESKDLNAFLTAARQASNTPHQFDMTQRENVQQGRVSSKIWKAYQNLQEQIKANPEHRAVIYSNFLESGLNPYAQLLQKHHVPYGMFTGDIDKLTRDKMVQDYNAGKLRALLLSSAGGEGLDLKGTRQMQILDPHFNAEKLNQVIGRGIRYHSHEALPEDQRKVKVEQYLSTLPEPGAVAQFFGQKADTGIDEYLQQMSRNKDALNQQMRDLLKSKENSAVPEGAALSPV